MSFGENLINLRRQKGWSQDDLANNLNISRQAISKWENNTSKPDVDNIEKISKIFSVKIDELLNNELPNDKAVALDVKKEEKKEKTITIVKLMIIAVIILYAISVIYKFASLLVIVNGVQKYANLNNYHYVITTYDENGLAEKEESWFKDGVSKTVSTNYSGNIKLEKITCIDFINNDGYILDTTNNLKTDVNMDDYTNLHNKYKNGGQLFSKFPVDIRVNTFFSILSKSVQFEGFNFTEDDCGNLILFLGSNHIVLKKDDFLPYLMFSSIDIKNVFYNIELNTVDDLEI